MSTLPFNWNLIKHFQVVGDRKGAVFGGLVEAPLKPSTKKRYQVCNCLIKFVSLYVDKRLFYPFSLWWVNTIQGSNDTFVFTNTPGRPVIYRPTGIAFSW